MPYQPTFPSPYLTAVDANAPLGNRFGVVINPRDIISAYEFKIFETRGGAEVLQTDTFRYSADSYETASGSVKDKFPTKNVYFRDSTGNQLYKFSICWHSHTAVSGSQKDFVFLKEGWVILLSEDKTSVSIYTDSSLETVAASSQHPSVNYENITVEEVDGTSGTEYISLPDTTAYNFLIYSSNKQSIDPPRYGSFENEVVVDEVVSDQGIIDNGKDYSWNMTLYDPLDNSITTPRYTFYARALPSIDFSVPDRIDTCDHTFTATYSQEQGERYLYYFFELYLDDVLIDSSNEKYDAKISYFYTGLLPDTEYKIRLVVVMPDKTEYERVKRFTVSYPIQESVVCPLVSTNSKEGYIGIDYSENVYVKANSNVPEEEQEYIEFKNSETNETVVSARLGKEQYVNYDKINERIPLDISEEFTVYLHINLSEGFCGKIIELTDNGTGDKYTVRYDGEKFYYKISGNPEVSYDPYVDEYGIHKETSVVHADGATVNDISYDTLYRLYDADVIENDDVFLFNDIGHNFWWHITLLPNEVLFKRGASYSGSVVTN